MAMAAVVAATSLVACAGDAENAEDGAGDEPPAATTPAPAPEAVPQATGAAPEGATPEMVAQGREIFNGKGNCMTCHGPEAQGTALAPNLTDDEWLNIDDSSWESIQQIVRNGVPTPEQHPSPMPPMGGAQLSDEEIRSVAAYVYSVSHQGG